jgi:hypothetical protein
MGLRFAVGFWQEKLVLTGERCGIELAGGRKRIVSFVLQKADHIQCETVFVFYVFQHVPMPGSKGFLWLNRLLFHTMHSDDFQTSDTTVSVSRNRPFVTKEIRWESSESNDR